MLSCDRERCLDLSSVLPERRERDRRERLESRRRVRAGERPCDAERECSRDLDRLLDLARDRDLYLARSPVSVFSFVSSVDLSRDSDFARLDLLSDRLVDLRLSFESLSFISDLRREDRDFLLSESRLESRLSFLECSMLSSLPLFRLCFFSPLSTLPVVLSLKKQRKVLVFLNSTHLRFNHVYIAIMY